VLNRSEWEFNHSKLPYSSDMKYKCIYVHSTVWLFGLHKEVTFFLLLFFAAERILFLTLTSRRQLKLYYSRGDKTDRQTLSLTFLGGDRTDRKGLWKTAVFLRHFFCPYIVFMFHCVIFPNSCYSPYGIKWLGVGNLDSVCVSSDVRQNN